MTSRILSYRTDDGTLLCGSGRAAIVDCPEPAAPAAAGPAALPPVTTTTVLTALRRLGLPALRVRTQPEDKTLINFDTIFYAEPRPVARTVTLLGRRVRIVATPAHYTWHHGDGTIGRTTRPGAPYPAKDIVHRYTDAHTTVTTSVDVTYTARFRVGAGGWQTIPGAVTIAGPGTPLRISEASAVLSGEHG